MTRHVLNDTNIPASNVSCYPLGITGVITKLNLMSTVNASYNSVVTFIQNKPTMLADEEKSPLLWKITIKHKSDTGSRFIFKIDLCLGRSPKARCKAPL